MAACKVEVPPPLQAQVWGGSRWADLAVRFIYVYIFMEGVVSFLHFCIPVGGIGESQIQSLK